MFWSHSELNGRRKYFEREENTGFQNEAAKSSFFVFEYTPYLSSFSLLPDK